MRVNVMSQNSEFMYSTLLSIALNFKATKEK